MALRCYLAYNPAYKLLPQTIDPSSIVADGGGMGFNHGPFESILLGIAPDYTRKPGEPSCYTNPPSFDSKALSRKQMQASLSVCQTTCPHAGRCLEPDTRWLVVP